MPFRASSTLIVDGCVLWREPLANLRQAGLGRSVCMDPRVPAVGFEPISTQVKETLGGTSNPAFSGT